MTRHSLTRYAELCLLLEDTADCARSRSLPSKCPAELHFCVRTSSYGSKQMRTSFSNPISAIEPSLESFDHRVGTMPYRESHNNESVTIQRILEIQRNVLFPTSVSVELKASLNSVSVTIWKEGVLTVDFQSSLRFNTVDQ